MIEAIAILAIGAAMLLYAEMKSNKETIKEQSRRIRHLTGNQNEEDKLESKNLLEVHHFNMILYKVQNDNDFKWFDKDIQIEEAKRLFENKYGHKFSDPFNEY